MELGKLFMFFNKTRPMSLQEVLKSLDDVSTTLYKYLNDKSYMPTERDLENVAAICIRYNDGFGFSYYFQRRLIQRSLQLPETSEKWTVSKLDY